MKKLTRYQKAAFAKLQRARTVTEITIDSDTESCSLITAEPVTIIGKCIFIRGSPLAVSYGSAPTVSKIRKHNLRWARHQASVVRIKSGYLP